MREGPQMAAADSFEVRVRGKGGHGAMPHIAVDTSLVASHIIIALQSVVSRNVDPLKAAIVSVCGMKSDTDTYNVIPDEVLLKGTTRYLHPEVQGVIRERMQALVTQTAAAYGAALS